MKSYKACLRNISQEEKDNLKSKTCIIGISVGQEYHLGEKLRAILKMVNECFDSCAIIVGDTLQRHTLCISHKSTQNGDELYDLSKEIGDEWMNNHLEMIKSEMNIPYKIIRWDECIASTKYKENYTKVKDAFDNDDIYKNIINKTVDVFLNRLIRGESKADLERVSKFSSAYLLEECACALEWLEMGYDYFVYPGDFGCFTETLNFFEPEKSKHSLHSLQLRFKSIATPGYEKINIDKIALECIMETLPVHVYWKDSNGTLIGCNTAQLNFLGKEDINATLGKSDFDFLPQIDALSVRENDLAVMKIGKTVTREESTNNSVFLSYKAPLKHQGAIVGIMGMSLDITKQKEAERELAEKNQMLTKAIKFKEEFLRNISHEIRTPLSCILKMSNMLFEDWERYPNNEARKAHLKMVVEGNNRLQNVLLNLLDLSKFNTDKVEYEKDRYSFKKSVMDVVGEFMDQRHRIRVMCRESNASLMAIYDHFRVEQVIRNLLANAINYGGTGDITINISAYKESVVFKITDSGVGVPDDELQEIFKMFTQSTRTKTGAGGTGMGLSISKTIIEEHGGIIWAENNANGVGSSFIFAIPFNAENGFIAADDAVGFQKHSIGISYDRDEKTSLLVIDDDASVLEVSRLVFNRMGFRTILASSAAEGLEVLKDDSVKIDLVLIDIMMPDMDGIELLRRIRFDLHLNDLPVYIYSGISSEYKANQMSELNIAGVIEKTSSADKISAMLSRFLIRSSCA